MDTGKQDCGPASNTICPSLSLSPPGKLALANLPTRISQISRFPAAFFGEGSTAGNHCPCKILVKHDDETGLLVSGNKIRKLEYLLHDAIAVRGCQRVVTCGGWQSNHCRATAAACARLGIQCDLLLRKPPSLQQQQQQQQQFAEGNLFIDQMCGAAIHWASPEEYASRRTERMQVIAQPQPGAASTAAYIIPEGGSNVLGLWGYVAAVQELLQQLDDGSAERLDEIYVAVGSAGTIAGIIVGLFLSNQLHRIRVKGILVCDSVAYFMPLILRLCNDFLSTFCAVPGQKEEAMEIRASDFDLLDAVIGPGYSIPHSQAQLSVMQLLARTEGILTDVSYTGKCFFGMMHHLQLQQGQHDPLVRRRRTVVFWHTGGVLAGLLHSSVTQLFPSANNFTTAVDW